MSNKCNGNVYRTTMVCIDSVEHNVLTGRIYNPSLEEGRQFGSLMDFLLQMEALLDGMQFPQSFTSARSFASVDPVTPLTTEAEIQHGKSATFAVRILFRQNASWQGSVSWLEGNREESFRSALELLLLMESALHVGLNDS